MSILGSKTFRDWRNRALCKGTACSVKGLFKTLRFRAEGWDQAISSLGEDSGYIIVLWHNVLMMPLTHPCGRDVHAIISSGRDGDYAAHVIRHFGVGAIRGSSSRNGARALLGAIKNRNIRRFAFTPDGPRGPRYQSHPGAAWLSEQLRLPVLPLGVAISRAWHLKSWDRYRIPKPFARVRFQFEAPIPPPTSQEDLESHKQHIHDALTNASLKAHQSLGLVWPD